MPATGDLLKLLSGLEIELQAIGPAHVERVTQLLADDFVEIGCSGMLYTKVQVIAGLGEAAPSSKLSAGDFSIKLLSPSIALLTYRARRDTSPPIHSLRVSVWQLQGEQWRMVFHQGTVTEGIA